MKVLRPLLVIVGVLAILATLCYWGLQYVRPSIGYHLEAEFATCPEDDQKLLDWIKTQPGIVSTPFTNRTTIPDGQRIELIFIMSQTIWREPPVPSFDAVMEEYGYRGQRQPFHRSPNRD